jgi:hypothetical protein
MKQQETKRKMGLEREREREREGDTVSANVMSPTCEFSGMRERAIKMESRTCWRFCACKATSTTKMNAGGGEYGFDRRYSTVVK